MDCAISRIHLSWGFPFVVVCFLFPFFVILFAIAISFCFLVYNYSFADALARFVFFFCPSSVVSQSASCVCVRCVYVRACVRACVLISIRLSLMLLSMFFSASPPPLAASHASLALCCSRCLSTYSTLHIDLCGSSNGTSPDDDHE